jgi:hypothetical protein
LISAADAGSPAASNMKSAAVMLRMIMHLVKLM